MDIRTVMVRWPFVTFLALGLPVTISTEAATNSLDGPDAMAHAVANELVVAYEHHAPLAACKPIPILVYLGQPSSSRLLLEATRAGESPIKITVNPAVPTGQLPPLLADVLNRIQGSGHKVEIDRRSSPESVGAAGAVAYVVEASLKTVAGAIYKLIGATVDEWASAGLGRYSATLFVKANADSIDEVNEVVLTCK
jgi:hypothetical protein